MVCNIMQLLALHVCLGTQWSKDSLVSSQSCIQGKQRLGEAINEKEMTNLLNYLSELIFHSKSHISAARVAHSTNLSEVSIHRDQKTRCLLFLFCKYLHIVHLHTPTHTFTNVGHITLPKSFAV